MIGYFADATDGSETWGRISIVHEEDNEYCEECDEYIENCECHKEDGTLWQCPKAIDGICPEANECPHSTPHEFITQECFVSCSGLRCICIKIANEFLSKEEMEM